ncbi:hypothetical protein HII31_12640 [Pseudocercospora fuligena]|uniref:Uncharacterized protein n=1 Tax=Pseudocercospora fuligena TaxID=685502 RepID=A0A8H6R6J9_9PEZI|nr:hypothetical protein HII31_12640 [Pseudocercospora fuligena]
MSRAGDNSGEDYKSTSMVSEDTDMTDVNGGVALGQAEPNRTAPSLQSIGENSNTAFATSSRHTTLMGGVPLAFLSSQFQTSTPSKTVSGTSDQAKTSLPRKSLAV